MRWILFPDDSNRIADMGGKAGALAALNRASLPIPGWFVIRGDACLQSLGETGRKNLADAADGSQIQELLKDLLPDEAMSAGILDTFVKLCGTAGFAAVRSSAAEEDGAGHSFAGQLDSYLFVSQARVLERVADVWRSGFGERLLTYRKQNGLPLAPHPPAVLVQRMINADAAGVAFSADPVTGRRGIAVVSAVFGLGSSLVSGEANADTWLVDRMGGIVETRIAEKSIAHRPAPDSPEGFRAEDLSQTQSLLPALSAEQVRAVAALARQCAEFFGRPQDIEWAMENGRLYLLQSRPITSISGQRDPDGVLNIWDNSNIAESYGGVTTPLTYTFARRAYEEVYRQFCRMMAVPEPRISKNAQVFHCMIGLVRGRVYYNLLNWYRVLAMLPGFTVNRHFMEQMMGVKEPLPEEVVRDLQSASTADRARDAIHLVRAIAGLAWNHFRLRALIRDFYARLNHSLRPPDPPLGQARPDELAAYYQELEGQLLIRWDAPLVNDFFAMIFYGVLRKLVSKWCGDADGTLQNNLLCGEGGIVSAEPARRVLEMAGIASKHPGLAQKLAGAPLEEALRELENFPEFAAAYHSYLDKFGDRCLDELKLESTTLHDDPTTLLRSVGNLALRAREPGATPRANPETDMRGKAKARAADALRPHAMKRIIFKWVLAQTRARVRDRENLRFERTRLFGRVRRIFVAMGRDFHARNLLASPADIFYLELGEILGFCDGTATTVDLKKLAALRQSEFAGYHGMTPPSDRFETRGPVNHGNTFQQTKVTGETASPTDGAWKGIGCSPGVVRGVVRIVSDPRNAILKPGEILVAERTDPGWIMLFASAAGVLVERGSLLSHSAIVSREMGIPSIVAIPFITRQLHDGEWVEMDGATGVVKRIQHD